MFTLYAPALQSTPVVSIAMSTSDRIQLGLTIVTAAVGFISIAIAVCSLILSKKMLEESTRPHITIYLNRLILSKISSDVYLIIKNFGSSSGKITSFSSSIDLELIAFNPSIAVPFRNIEGTVLAPGQSMPFLIKTSSQYQTISFQVCYTWMKKTYSESINVNLAAYSAQEQVRHISRKDSIESLAYALQEIAYKMM